MCVPSQENENSDEPFITAPIPNISMVKNSIIYDAKYKLFAHYRGDVCSVATALKKDWFTV